MARLLRAAVRQHGVLMQPDAGILAEARDVIHVAYHLFCIAGSDDPCVPPGRTNGLADADDDCVAIHTGIHSGPVAVAVQVREGRPGDVDLTWDEVVEISLHASSGRTRIVALMADVPDTFPPLTPNGAGDYRLRVHARGRDTDIDGTAFEAFETYFIQIWPDQPGPEVVHKATDRYGAQLRATWNAPRLPPTTPDPDAGAAARLRNLSERAREMGSRDD